MQLDSLLRREILLLQFELRRQIEQAKFLLLLRNHFVEERQVIAEKEDTRGIVHLCILTHIALKKDRRHRRDILVAETQVGLRKTRIAWLHRSDANLALFVLHVPREDFLRQRHAALGSLNRRQEHFPLHPCHIERK